MAAVSRSGAFLWWGEVRWTSVERRFAVLKRGSLGVVVSRQAMLSRTKLIHCSCHANSPSPPTDFAPTPLALLL